MYGKWRVLAAEELTAFDEPKNFKFSLANRNISKWIGKRTSSEICKLHEQLMNMCYYLYFHYLFIMYFFVFLFKILQLRYKKMFLIHMYISFTIGSFSCMYNFTFIKITFKCPWSAGFPTESVIFWAKWLIKILHNR